MPLSLKTKFTLTTSLVVLVVVALVSWLFLARLTNIVIRQANERAGFVAQQVFDACRQALANSAEHGEAPNSDSPADMRDYVQNSLDNSSALNTLLESAVGYSPTIYEITISDQKGKILVSSDASMRGDEVVRRPNVSLLVHSNFLQQLQILYGPPRVYEVSIPFDLGSIPFGEVRVGLSSILLRDQIFPGLENAGLVALGAVLFATLLAALLSRIGLAPLAQITAQLDQISAGKFDLAPIARADELGLVSTKISNIGKQLRDVREVFSTLRENLDQVMSGLEDGLLLFNADGRCVLGSPSIEKFLGVMPGTILGRRVGEIFGHGHPMRDALGLQGDRIVPVESVEVRLDSPNGPRRIAISAQAIAEKGEQMGTLVSLRDLESYERLGSQLQVSERLAAIGRVTAGVAHEVKNPLNSMRVWLEVLKGSLSTEAEPQQAVKMLDTEIDRLDRAVKTFLDFTRPVEIELEETDLPGLLNEVIEGARPSIARAGVVLALEIPSAFPTVRMDRRLIHQGLLNLILNACDAMTPGGQLTISLRQNGEMAEIRISDTGKGISQEDRGKIFQLFYTTRPGGTGIGLANTFRFVQLHNGSIEFVSEVGRGTTFTVELPLGRSVETPVPKLRDYTKPFAQGKM
ncbi:MAG: ATP-binding protein [Candidatus Acidiferrales bacterium]|jgi:signal transduction histidine kinase